MARKRKAKLAVWKFASCDGCQLTLLDCEDELLALTDRIDIAYFPEATSARMRGPYDVSLVEVDPAGTVLKEYVTHPRKLAAAA